MVDELRHLAHLLVVNRVQDEEFRRRGQGNPKIRPVERRAHGLTLRSELATAFDESDEGRERAGVSLKELQALGTFVTLEGANAAYPLKLDSLEQRTSHRRRTAIPKWLLMSVQPAVDDLPERAVVWVSDAYRSEFLKIFEDYLNKTSTAGDPKRWETPDGNPKNRHLVANIARIRRVILDDLWQSAGRPVKYGMQWWELWLEGSETAVESLRAFANDYGLRVRDRVLLFNNRIVMWVESSWNQLEILPFTSVPLAEIRRPEFIESVEDLVQEEQDEYVRDLADRVLPAPDHAPAVCHLDTGVARTHVLLAESLSESDLHSVVGTSGSGFDMRGHGTSMASLALYGPLDDLLTSTGTIQLHHRLESVRVIPNSGEPITEPDDYGTVTIQAVALPEVTITRPRVFCMPVSTHADRPGEPTLWSASIDALAVGVDVVREGAQLKMLDAPDMAASRLMIISAGNATLGIGDLHDYLAESDTSVVDDPAQAWNVIVVGAYTELATPPEHPQYNGWRVVAERGQLSPHSRTSVLFGPKWPIRPDICLEGGNVLTNGEAPPEDRLPSLSLRATGAKSDLALTSANATSAATAQAARLAALVMSQYPTYWPETVRALMVHAAEWTAPMRAEINAKRTGRPSKSTCCAVTAGGCLLRILYSGPQGRPSPLSFKMNSCHSKAQITRCAASGSILCLGLLRFSAKSELVTSP